MAATPNRNVPCPCGSGLKFKHCHGRPGASAPEDQQRGRRLQRIRAETQVALRSWSTRHLGRAHIEGAAESFMSASGLSPYDSESEKVRSLFLAWMDLFSVPEGGPRSYPDPDTAVGGLLARGRLTPAQRRFLEAAAREPFTLWTAEEVGPGPWLRMRDRILEREVRLYDPDLAEIAAPGTSLFGQIVELDGVAVIFSSDDALILATHIAPFEDLRERLGADDMTPADLLPFDLDLLEVYGEFVYELIEDGDALDHEDAFDDEDEFDDEAPFAPGGRLPAMQTTTGDPVEPSTLRFRLAEGKRRDILALLDDAADFEVDHDGEAEGQLPAVWFGAGGEASMAATVHAFLRLDPWGLSADVMSQPRATALRERLEELGAGRLVFESAEVLSFEEALRRFQDAGVDVPPAPTVDPDDLPAEIVEYMRGLFLAWADESVPALDGLSPREAVRRPAYRARVIELVDDWERMGRGQPPMPGADFAELRAELGLDGGG